MVTALAVYAWFATTWSELWKSDPARKRWIGYLTLNRKYRQIMGGVLGWIDTRLSPEVGEGRWSVQDRRTAWSHMLLNWTLFIALAYPIFSIFVIWVVTGDAGRIGNIVVLPPTTDAAARALPAMVLLAFGILFTYSQIFKSRGRWALFVAAIGILFFGIETFPSGAFAIAVSVSFALAAAIAFAISFAGAVAGAYGVAVAVGFAAEVAGAAEFGIAVVVAAAAAIVVALIVRWFGERTGRPTLTLLLAVAIGLAAILMTVRYGAAREERIASDSAIILFIGILPLLNALADFASLGLTRYCLRRGLTDSPLRWGLIDLAGGAAIFTALVLASMAIAAFVQWPDGTPLLDLAALLADIRANPGDYWWLYLTFLSTLLPTLVHLGIALFAQVFESSETIRSYIVKGLEDGGKGDDPRGRMATRVLCLVMTTAIMLPIIAFGTAIQYHGWVGTGLLNLFEGIARVSGMI